MPGIGFLRIAHRNRSCDHRHSPAQLATEPPGYGSGSPLSWVTTLLPLLPLPSSAPPSLLPPVVVSPAVV